MKPYETNTYETPLGRLFVNCLGDALGAIVRRLSLGWRWWYEAFGTIVRQLSRECPWGDRSSIVSGMAWRVDFVVACGRSSPTPPPLEYAVVYSWGGDWWA